MGFSRQEYWSGLPCPPPRDLPDPGIQPASPVSPALQADSLPEQPGKHLHLLTWLKLNLSRLWNKRLLEASWWERLTVGKLGLVLMGWAMLSKSLIQFFLDGEDCVLSLLFDLRPNYGGDNEDRSFKRSCVPLPHSVPPILQQATTSPRLCQRLLDNHGQVWVKLLSPGSWCPRCFLCVLQESVSPGTCKFRRLYCGVNGDLF